MKRVFILIGIVSMFIVNCFVLGAVKTIDLNGTSWELVQIQRKGKNAVIPKESNITINFTKNRIGGFSGVNNYDGQYKIKNNSILSASVATTLMAGPEEKMDIEQSFFDILQSFPKINYNRTSLILRNNKGEVWTFKVMDLSKKIHNTKWKLVNMAGKDISSFFLQYEDGITLFFNENGINGNAGINNYFGNYKITGNIIEIAGIGATKMAGSQNLMKIETEYLSLLEKVKKMKMIDERSLVLTTENGKTLTFEKIYD